MLVDERRALYQGFLPDDAEHAYVWKYSQPIGGRRPRHFHAEPELNLVVRGSATFGIGDRIASVSAGELILFPSGQDHVLLGRSPDLYLYAIGLDSAYAAEVVGAAGDGSMPLHVRLSPDELATAVGCAAAIVERPRVEDLGAELWLRLHWLGRRAGAPAGSVTHVLTRRALSLMQAAPELGLEALAKRLRAHPSEVSRHFHRDMGMRLVRYRTRLRLLDVIRLVDAGHHDLTAAASASGFGSYSQCHRTFMAELGCAPRTFFSSGLRAGMQLTYDD